jgi:hypothetical protein
MLNGAHATLGRQVSTWAHAVKSERVSHVGGLLSHYVILLLSLGSRASEPFFLCVCICIPTHSEENPHGKVVCPVHSPILCLNSRPPSSTSVFCSLVMHPEPRENYGLICIFCEALASCICLCRVCHNCWLLWPCSSLAKCGLFPLYVPC